MKSLDSAQLVQVSKGGLVLCLGNFDGAHRGHQALAESALVLGRKLGVPTLAFTFRPHPLEVLGKAEAPRLLYNLSQLKKYLPLDYLWVENFDLEYAQMSGEKFFRDRLLKFFNPRGLVVGEGFRFGRGREAGVVELKNWAGELPVVGVEEVRLQGEVVSSTRIRAWIAEGDVLRAREFLGRPFSILDVVRPGESRKIGFPTLNFSAGTFMVPKSGVYVTAAALEDQRVRSVTNVGRAPTFGSGELKIETHLLDWSGDLYHKEVEVFFLSRIRDEKKFSSLDELRSAIHNDIQMARSYRDTFYEMG